jgi:hypothetical protein
VPTRPGRGFDPASTALEQREVAKAAELTAGPVTPTTAARPGEVVRIDTTPLDVMAVLEDGGPVGSS